jgi:hypothetical protein
MAREHWLLYRFPLLEMGVPPKVTAPQRQPYAAAFNTRTTPMHVESKNISNKLKPHSLKLWDLWTAYDRFHWATEVTVQQVNTNVLRCSWNFSTLAPYRAECRAKELNFSTLWHALFPGKLTTFCDILLRSVTLQIRYEVRHVFHSFNSLKGGGVHPVALY